MTTDNHTNILSNKQPANAAIINAPLEELDAAIGARATLGPTPKTSLVAAIGTVAPNTTAKTLTGAINEILGTLTGGATVTDATLKGWTEAEAYEIVENPIIYDATYPELLSDDATNTVKWPDGSSGEFAVSSHDATWRAINAYTITHVASGKTVTQTAVTRDATTGAVTAKPALTVGATP